MPRAPSGVRGSLTLRGRIVTVVDIRVRLGVENRPPTSSAAGAAKATRRRQGASQPAADGSGAADENAHPAQEESPDKASRPPAQGNRAEAAGVHGMCVTVEHENELYTLLVDKVGDVISLSEDCFEDNPSTLDVVWREFALGVYRLDSALMVVLDVARLLDIKSARD